MNEDRKKFVEEVAAELNRGNLLHCHQCFCHTDSKQHQHDHDFIRQIRKICGRVDEIRWNMIQLIVSAILLATLAAMGFDKLLQYIHP